MKNDVMKHSLNRELEEVRVSGALKKRILAEAAVSRAPEKRKRVSIAPLAAAAAVVLVIGLAAGVTMLRSEKPDLSAVPLSAATTKPVKKVVWVSDDDGLYHWEQACSSMTDARSMTPEEARADGRKACSECLREDGAESDMLVWITNFGNYYHARHDCSGITGAVGVMEIEAKTLGRKPCQMCVADGEIFYDPEIAATVVPSMIPVPLDDDVEAAYTAATLQPFTVVMPEATWSPATEEPMPTPKNTPTPKPIEVATKVPAATLEPAAMDMATPAATPEPTQAPEREESMSVWMTDGGVYYHVNEHCSGMNGAESFSEDEANAAGKKPCSVCMPEPEAEEAVLPTEEPGQQEVAASSVAVVVNEEGDVSFWMTDGGVYYHVDEHCSGMTGAHVCTEEEAAKAGKILCMVCMPEEVDGPTVQWSTEASADVVYDVEESADGPMAEWSTSEEAAPVYDAEEAAFWMTDGGVYYHVDEHCSGMTGAHVCNEAEAVRDGKLPCPACLEDASAGVNGPEAECVWATDRGVYYHMDEHCSGMEDAVGRAVTEALADGKLPCPKCAKQFGAVWATESGAYFHLDSECSGMTEAVEMTWAQAEANGKTLCPVCHEQLVQAASESLNDAPQQESAGAAAAHHSESKEHHSASKEHH